MTFDVPIQKSGLIPQPFVEQLRAVGQAMKQPAGSGSAKVEGLEQPLMAKYPDDTGLASNPAVLLFDDFESGEITCGSACLR